MVKIPDELIDEQVVLLVDIVSTGIRGVESAWFEKTLCPSEE